MKEFIIEAPLKGQRTYIQGPDICDKIFAYLGRGNRFELTMRQTSDHKLLATSNIRRNNSHLREIGNFTVENNIQTSASQITKYILLETETKINSRVPYNESKLREDTYLSQDIRIVKFMAIERFSAIELITSWNKYLVNEFIENGRWLFTQIKLNSIPLTNTGQFKLKIKSQLGTAMAITSIYHNDSNIGSIVFNKGK